MHDNRGWCFLQLYLGCQIAANKNSHTALLNFCPLKHVSLVWIICCLMKETCLFQGNVEVWLGQLLAGVRQTLHAIIRQAYLAISDPGLKLLEFQSAFPAQVGLLGIQMIWTKDAEDALVLSKSDKKVILFRNKSRVETSFTIMKMISAHGPLSLAYRSCRQPIRSSWTSSTS